MKIFIILLFVHIGINSVYSAYIGNLFTSNNDEIKEMRKYMNDEINKMNLRIDNMILETNNFSFNVAQEIEDFIRAINNTLINTLPSRLKQINNNENTIKDNMITTNNRFNQIEKLIKEIQTSMNLNMKKNIKSFNQIET